MHQKFIAHGLLIAVCTVAHLGTNLNTALAYVPVPQVVTTVPAPPEPCEGAATHVEPVWMSVRGNSMFNALKAFFDMGTHSLTQIVDNFDKGEICRYEVEITEGPTLTPMGFGLWKCTGKIKITIHYFPTPELPPGPTPDPVP